MTQVNPQKMDTFQQIVCWLAMYSQSQTNNNAVIQESIRTHVINVFTIQEDYFQRT